MEEDQGEYPDSLLYHFPSQVRLDALPELVDISVSRTLLTALLTALKANGTEEDHFIYFLETNVTKNMHWILTGTSREISPVSIIFFFF